MAKDVIRHSANNLLNMEQIYFVTEVFCTVGYSLPAAMRDDAHYFVVSTGGTSAMPTTESPG